MTWRKKSGPHGGGPDQKSNRATAGLASTIAHEDDGRPLWPAGCPCGHAPDRDWDCIRHRPLPLMVDWVVTSAYELGIQPHDRGQCPYCAGAVA